MRKMTRAISTQGKRACCFNKEAWIAGTTCSSELHHDQSIKERPPVTEMEKACVLRWSIFRNIVVGKSIYRRWWKLRQGVRITHMRMTKRRKEKSSSN